MKKPLKWIAIVLGPVAVFVVAVMGVEALIDSSVPEVNGEGNRGYWGEAIQAVSTVVVMAATAVLAVITYRTLQVMKQQTMTMAESSTRAHVTEFSRFLTTWINSLLALKRSVGPGGPSTVDMIADQDKAMERVTLAMFELASFASACPPNIMMLIPPVTDASNNAIEMVHLVRKSIVQAAFSAVTGNLPFSGGSSCPHLVPCRLPDADRRLTRNGSVVGRGAGCLSAAHP